MAFEGIARYAKEDVEEELMDRKRRLEELAARESDPARFRQLKREILYDMPDVETSIESLIGEPAAAFMQESPRSAQLEHRVDPAGRTRRIEDIMASVPGQPSRDTGPPREFRKGTGAAGEPYYTNLSDEELGGGERQVKDLQSYPMPENGRGTLSNVGGRIGGGMDSGEQAKENFLRELGLEIKAARMPTGRAKASAVAQEAAQIMPDIEVMLREQDEESVRRDLDAAVARGEVEARTAKVIHQQLTRLGKTAAIDATDIAAMTKRPGTLLDAFTSLQEHGLRTPEEEGVRGPVEGQPQIGIAPGKYFRDPGARRMWEQWSRSPQVQARLTRMAADRIQAMNQREVEAPALREEPEVQMQDTIGEAWSSLTEALGGAGKSIVEAATGPTARKVGAAALRYGAPAAALGTLAATGVGAPLAVGGTLAAVGGGSEILAELLGGEGISPSVVGTSALLGGVPAGMLARAGGTALPAVVRKVAPELPALAGGAFRMGGASAARTVAPTVERGIAGLLEERAAQHGSKMLVKRLPSGTEALMEELRSLPPYLRDKVLAGIRRAYGAAE
jgi:hypothetical protein